MRLSSSSLVHKHRGVALIMAILIVALATILATSVASDGYMDQRRSSTALLVDQAYAVALGGEAEAAAVLEKDKQDTSHQYDGLDESWAQPVVLPIEDYGELRGNLDDLQGRFNLNNLVNIDGSVNEETLAQFTNLLDRLQIDDHWAGIIVDWIDPDSTASFPSGAEDSVYSQRTPPYLTANRPTMQTSELLSLVDGYGKPFGMDNYRKLEPYVASLPIGTALNVCTAPPEVLDSLASSSTSEAQFSTGAGSADIATTRKSTCFPKITDVKTAFQQDKGFQTLMTKHPGYLAEKSSFFRANIVVTLGTTELAMYSVLQRADSGKVHVISRSFGSP